MAEPSEPVQDLIEQLQTGSSRDAAFRRLYPELDLKPFQDGTVDTRNPP